MGNTVHILPWFLFSSKSILTFFTVDANTQKLQIQTFSKIKTSLVDLIAQYKAYKKALGETNLSISDFIKWLISGQAQIDATKLKILALRGAALLLNMALGVVTGLVVSSLIGAITSYAQRIDTAATKTKEAADAANNTTSSLKDLVDAYEELGDKSGWSTEDFDQAKDIQEELLALAKEQGTLDENKANQLDLQNGKYEEQLGLLKDITEEQLKASESKLIQSKDAQGNKLIKTAKDNNRSHFFSSVSANTNRGIMNELKDAGIDVFNKNGSFGAKDLNDPDSIAKYYSELGRALDYIVQNTTEAQRAAGGAYNTVYKYLMDEQSALRDDVDSYNDSTDAVNENVNARRKLQAVDFWQNDNNNSMDVSFTFDKVNSAVQTLEDTIDGFDASKLNELLWGTNEGLSDEQAQALANLRKALTDMDFSADTNGVNAFIQALVQVGIVAQSSANGVDALAAGAQKMEDISSKMDEIQSAYKASTSAMEEYNQYGYMSLDSLQSLLTMNTEYLNCLELVNGKLQINKQSYAELLAAEYAEAAATILSNAQHEVANLTADDTAESTDDLKEKTEAEKTALENLLPALKNATAATATYSAAQEFANEVEKAGERGVDPAKLEEITNRTNTQLSLLYTNMNAALKGGQALTNQLNGFGSSSKNAGKSSSTTSKSVADLSSAFDTLTKAMKEYNQYGYISADTMKSLIGVDDKFTACLTEQNGKLELNTAKFRTFVRAQLEEANAANDGGKSAGEMKKILDWLNSSVDSETISFEQLTDAIKGYGTAMDEAKEKTDAIKSAFSGLKDVIKTLGDSQFGIADADSIDKQTDAIRNLVTQYKDYPDLLNNIVDENGNINLNTEAFKNALAKTLEDLANTAKETGGAGADALYNVYHSASQNISQGKITPTDWASGLGTDLSNANDTLDRYQSNWNTLKDAMDEWNETGQLTQDTMQNLMALPDEFSSLLGYDEDGNAKDEGYVASAGSANTSSSCAGNSASATKLTSSAGSATQPVYFKDGKPVAGTYTLGDASSKTVRTLGAVGNTGWANKTTDDKYIPTMSFMAYWNGAYSGTSSNLQYCDRGRFGTIVTKGSGDYAAAGHTHNYAGSGSAGGSANSAVKLDSNAGSSVQPVYFSGGKPVAIGYTISSSVPANAKFTDTTYGVASSSSNGLMSSTDKTKLDDFSRVISIQKQIKLTTDWLDTGIAGNSLDTGTYVVQVSGFNSSYTQLYSEIYSGVMSWYSGTTNSGNSSEIFLHNAGLADNNNAIYLRTLRVAGSKTLKLQIACKVAATGTDILTFKFRRLI